MALTKTTTQEQFVLGFECIETAPPPPVAQPTPTPQPTPKPPPINTWGGGGDDTPSTQCGGSISVFDYQDSNGRCWRVIQYPPCGNFANTSRSPTPCP